MSYHYTTYALLLFGCICGVESAAPRADQTAKSAGTICLIVE